jgi:hypothetical protein
VPNALLPIITASVLYFGAVIAGAIGVEYVFSYPGLGLETLQALNNLAWVLCTSPEDKLRDGKRAVELAAKACELTDNGCMMTCTSGDSKCCDMIQSCCD